MSAKEEVRRLLPPYKDTHSYLRPVPQSSGDISKTLMYLQSPDGKTKRSQELYDRWVAEIKNVLNRSLPAANTKLNQGLRSSTAWQQLLFILNEAPVGVFQVAPSKNKLGHTTFQSSAIGAQRNGVEGEVGAEAAATTTNPTSTSFQTQLLVFLSHMTQMENEMSLIQRLRWRPGNNVCVQNKDGHYLQSNDKLFGENMTTRPI